METGPDCIEKKFRVLAALEQRSAGPEFYIESYFPEYFTPDGYFD